MTFGISFFGWILLITAFGGFLTFTKTVNRLGKTGTSLWLFIMALFFVCLFGSLMMSVLELSVLVTLYASLYLGRLMTGHLVDGIERHTDPLVPLVLPVAYFGINVHSHYVFAVVSSYLLLIIILLIYQTFNSLKQFWVWKNPPVHEKG